MNQVQSDNLHSKLIKIFQYVWCNLEKKDLFIIIFSDLKILQQNLTEISKFKRFSNCFYFYNNNNDDDEFLLVLSSDGNIGCSFQVKSR